MSIPSGFDAAFYLPPKAGILQVQGADRLDFIQRQSTNDLRSLKPGQVIGTVLTSPTARILDVLLILPQEAHAESLVLFGLPGYSPATEQFLRSRIFFNDRVIVQDISQEYCQIWLYGEQVDQVLAKLSLPDPVAGEVLDVDYEQQPLRLFRVAGYAEQRCYLSAPLVAQPGLLLGLRTAGALELDQPAHEALRISAGLPAAGRELTDTFTPLEVGLQALISGSKGCYTGQEVIARQLTYDKVTRSLVGVVLMADSEAGAPVWAAAKQVGQITSVAGRQALAVIKRPFAEPGQAILVGDSPDQQPALLRSLDD